MYLWHMEALSFNFNPFPVLETERLVLRQYTAQDAEALFSFRSNPQAMRFVPRPLQQSVDDAMAMIDLINNGIAANDTIAWAIELKSTSKVIGSLSFHVIQKEHHRAELGYMIHPDYWGKGIVPEAAAAAVHYGFNHLRFHSIEAIIDPVNVASARVLDKLGFVREAYFRENFVQNGVFTDTAIYSLLRSDYLNNLKE